MLDYERELTQLVQKKQLVPFVGAGFSIACGLPSWEELIQHLLSAFNVDPSDIQDKADFPRIAEYLKISNHGEIEPIISEIQKLFDKQNIDISNSDHHLHLVSLDTPLIYTTNYDNLIEKAFEYVGRKYSMIVRTEDIVKPRSSDFPQIIKFHGSLEYKETMVLAESDYFSRLELESPMDIKFRSDILGKSIIFIGYSFSDFNIRYLWFKLKQMMKGIKEQYIPKSFIVLSNRDKMMEALFTNIDIIPIHLDDYNGFSETERLASFLESIIVKSNGGSDWPFDKPAIATSTQIEKLVSAIQNRDTDLALTCLWLLNNSILAEKQVNIFKTGKLKFVDDIFDFWFKLIQKTNAEERRQLTKFFLKLRDDHRISCYNIVVINFLRYREVRDVEAEKNYVYFHELMKRKELLEQSEFQMLFDSIVWTCFSQGLRKDTTLYYFLFISTYFQDRMNDKILNLSRFSELSNLPSALLEMTPQRVLDYMNSAAPWLPPLRIFDTYEFDRVCDSYGCDLHVVDEFDWKLIWNIEEVANNFSCNVTAKQMLAHSNEETQAARENILDEP